MFKIRFKLVLMLVLCSSLFTINSFGWGDREQAAVWGGIGGILLGSMINNSNNNQSYNRNYYSEPQPVYVEKRYYREPVYIVEPRPRVYIEERPYYREHHHYYGR
jgi:hypothetical protein